MTAPFFEFPMRPVPPITEDTREWWDQTRERRLTVQSCRACRAVQLYPRCLCVACGSSDVELVSASGLGTVYSRTVLSKSPNPDFFVPPYVVALVRLEEGPVVLTNIVGTGATDVECDAPVTVTWDAMSDGRHLPLFTPVSSPDPSG